VAHETRHDIAAVSVPGATNPRELFPVKRGDGSELFVAVEALHLALGERLGA
jgi:hypothetical protein